MANKGRRTFQLGEKSMENYDSLRILFIRHAETNYDNWVGRDPSDGELTPFGEEQCNILGEKLKNDDGIIELKNIVYIS